MRREARIVVGVTEVERDFIERASELVGLPASAFVRSSVLRAAIGVFQEWGVAHTEREASSEREPEPEAATVP